MYPSTVSWSLITVVHITTGSALAQVFLHTGIKAERFQFQPNGAKRVLIKHNEVAGDEAGLREIMARNLTLTVESAR